MSINHEEIPADLSEHINSWTKNSFESTVELIESWLDYALKKMYGKQKGPELKEKIKERIRNGKITIDKINNYWEVLENGDRDARYLYPYFLTLYFVAKSKAEDFHRKGLITEAFSTTSLMSFCVGSLTENVETNTVGVPDYTDDPRRAKIANDAVNAKHIGTKAVQKMVVDLLSEKRPSGGWASNKAAAAKIEKALISQLYIASQTTSADEETYKPRPDLGFKLTLKATALHDRILKWMGTGKEGVPEINNAINTTRQNRAKSD
ncbi:hypothetical protein [Pseudomonas sp. 1928-m]|uniref:hypothetical protein n=1 Tax=Pseudomonas sp. 1928-m TaxID=3033804 RepID=UPI0023DFE9C9|nr:hypothetical protein [Pseudomonas sp. 1928-m]MDF3195244.1 hypothetical protein [Pseudomonas sp. 1928-m]